MTFNLESICLDCPSLLADGRCLSKDLKKPKQPVKKCKKHSSLFPKTVPAKDSSGGKQK
jgi:hypothetical protein